jgi:hypothetical protein
MADLLSTIKQASMAAMTASNPAAVMFGKITKIEPLEVNVDQRFILPTALLIVPESLIHYEIVMQHTHQYTDSTDSGSTTRTTQPALPDEPIVIRRGLEIGDSVLLLRVQGGQKYVILDRVVSDDDT